MKKWILISVLGLLVSMLYGQNKVPEIKLKRMNGKSVMLQDFLNYFVLGWVNKADYFHFATALRTDHGINLVHPLDQHRPCLAATSRKRDTSIALAQCLCRFFRLVGVPAIVADNMRAFGRNVLSELR